MGVGAGLAGTRRSLKPKMREIDTSQDENLSSGLSDFPPGSVPNGVNRHFNFKDQSTQPFSLKDTNRDMIITQRIDQPKSKQASPRKFGLAGKMIRDEKQVVYAQPHMTEPDLVAEEEIFSEKRGVIERMIYDQVANPVPPPEVTEVFMMRGPPAEMQRLQARVDEDGPPPRDRIEVQMASEVARHTSPLRQRNKGAFKDLDPKHQDERFAVPERRISEVASNRTRQSATSEAKKRPLKKQVELSSKNPAQLKRVSQLLDFNRANRIDAIDDDSYIKQYYK